jgi:capsular exopolysaccharide synthesis family protein
MSHIFDALQRSEAERGGAETESLASELLRLANATVLGPAQEARIFAPKEELIAPAPSAPAVTVQTSSETRELLGQFASLPIVLFPDSKLVSITDKESLAAEKFRFLAVRLRQIQQRKPLKRLLVTSTIPEEGKSLVSANLACTLARRKQNKVLLLDGDLRRPTLEKQLGLGRITGLSECLQGSFDLSACVHQLDALGIWILPAGRTPQNPLELMQSGRLSVLMDQLNGLFDWIVIDSPPVLPLADTSIWSRLADGILLVTRQGTTEKKQLQLGLDALEQPKLLGAVINASTDVVHTDYYQRYGSHAERSATPNSK